MTTARQIEIFVKVAELGSVRLAAEAMDVSQPTLSKHLKALERQLGGLVFDRHPGRRLVLSPLGRQVLADARRSLTAHQRIGVLARQSAPEASPVIFVRSFMSGQVRRHYDALLAGGIPASARFVLVDDREDLLAHVRQTAGSLGILRSGTSPEPEGLQLTVLRTEPVSLYAAPGLAAQWTSGNVQAQDLVYYDPSPNGLGDGWGNRLLELAGLAAIEHQPAPQFIEIVFDKVLRGEGIGLFLDWHAREAVESGQLARMGPDSQPAYLLLAAHPAADPQVVAAASRVFARHG